jgi:hypothetical protein
MDGPYLSVTLGPLRVVLIPNPPPSNYSRDQSDVQEDIDYLYSHPSSVDVLYAATGERG